MKISRLSCLLIAALSSGNLWADVKPNALFQDNMVLQRDKEVRVWGVADPGESVKVQLGNLSSATTKADASGRWLIILPPQKMYNQSDLFLTVSGKNKLIFKNVLIGEVFIAGGQSNMEVPIKEALNPEFEAKNATNPLLREFKVEHDFDVVPQDNCIGKWNIVTPETAPEVGAVGYFFARELYSKLNVPIGIINNSYSASPAEAWVPLETLRRNPKLYDRLLKEFDKRAQMGKENIISTRETLGNAFKHKDFQNYGEALRYAEPNYIDKGWKDVSLPGYLENTYGEVDGAFWFRKSVNIPVDWSNHDLILNLGAVDDQDTTYFNGVKIGATINDHPDYWDTKRSYKVPGNLVKAGKNVIAVRCFDEAHAGGIVGPEINLQLTPEKMVDLKGIWKSDYEEIRKPLPWPTDYLSLVKIYRVGSVLYNAMFNPLKNYSVRGIIWYQGESNADNAQQYQTLFQDLIKSWRQDLRDEKMPFMFVQLASYNAPTANPNAKSPWAELRQAQEMALILPVTSMVPTIDIGDQKRIHPLNKQEVGRRLGLTALKNIFGDKNVNISFPSAVKISSIAPGKVLITFDGVDAANKLQTTDGKDPKCFAVADGTRKFEWAEAKIVAPDQIELSAPTIKEIVWVRYAWGQYPEVNLFNGDKFPALPFEKNIASDAAAKKDNKAKTK